MSDRRLRSMLIGIRRRLVVARGIPDSEPRAVVRFADRLLQSSGDHRDLSPRERELAAMQAELARLAGRSDEQRRGV